MEERQEGQRILGIFDRKKMQIVIFFHVVLSHPWFARVSTIEAKIPLEETMLESLKSQGQDLLTLESLPASAVVEIAMVECELEQMENYHKMRSLMLPLLQSQKGFLAWRAFKSKTKEGVLLDLLYWESVEDCHKAGEILQNSDTGKSFFSLMKQTLVFELFERQAL